MVMQERKALFGGTDRGWTSPEILLLDKVLDELSPEKQIKKITEMLKQEEVWDNVHEEEAIPLVEALEKLFENQEVAFRAQLMKIYSVIPTVKDGGRYYKEKIEVAPKLKIAILGKIIQGWNWIRPWKEQCRFSEDAETCFRFLCEAFKEAPLYYKCGSYPNPLANREFGNIRKRIPDLFREHVEKKSNWQYYELDPWILSENVPNEIAIVLLKARTRLGGLSIVQNEIRFLQPFELPNRSVKAKDLVQDLMMKVRITEELAQELVTWIQAKDQRGNLNPKTIFRCTGDKVDFELVSERSALIKITFCTSHCKPEQKAHYPQIIAEVQSIRDALLESELGGAEDLPVLLIEAKGLDGFEYKEK